VAEGEGDEAERLCTLTEVAFDVVADAVAPDAGTPRAKSVVTPEGDQPKCMLITDPPFVEHPTTTAAVDKTMKTFAMPSEIESLIDYLSFFLAAAEPEVRLRFTQRGALPFRGWYVTIIKTAILDIITFIARLFRGIK
jgi:hypothetical protein